MQPSVDPFLAAKTVARRELPARWRSGRTTAAGCVFLATRLSALPTSRPPVRLIYRLCRARSERSSVGCIPLPRQRTVNFFRGRDTSSGGGGGGGGRRPRFSPRQRAEAMQPSVDPRASWLLSPRQQARVWQGESLEIGQDDRGASPSPPALPLLPTFAFA